MVHNDTSYHDPRNSSEHILDKANDNDNGANDSVNRAGDSDNRSNDNDNKGQW